MKCLAWMKVTTMRPIDGDKLQESPIRANRCDKEHANEHFINGIETVLEYAEQLPTVDAVYVTRCKNCRSYNKPKTGWCEVHLDREHPDDFCSYGERKDGGGGDG